MERYFKIIADARGNNEEIILNEVNIFQAINGVNMNVNFIVKIVECDERGLELSSVSQANELLPLVSKCKPTGYEKNNLPTKIRHAYCEAVEIYQHIFNYEKGIIKKDEFIKKVEETKRKH